DHDLVVAQYALMIAPDERTGTMAWVAGLVHSFDRFVKRALLLDTQLDEYLSLLPEGEFSTDEIAAIKEAIKNHAGPNGPENDLLLMTLQDADRVANVGATVIIRSGQLYNQLPALQPQFVTKFNPGSTYREPKSCLDDLRYIFDWESSETNPKFGLRLPEARNLAAPHFRFLREFFGIIQCQFEETGLSPWPID
ncbi:MAG: hypothetical protein NTV81_03755, partial [Candidatus Komeilibacteria bacterium]|nr:hypothetical protein [Candidatus Komeilibacteria bacterium]